jgi:hypothetical protein
MIIPRGRRRAAGVRKTVGTAAGGAAAGGAAAGGAVDRNHNGSDTS